jgi:ABC-type multidrug transport system ATPase subunit
LDQEAGEILDQVLQEVAREGRTILMTSHDLVRAASLASRLAVLTKGKVRASLSREELKSTDLVTLYRGLLKDGGDLA